MSSRELEVGLGSLSFARHMLLRFLDGTPEDLWFHIAVPGGNHAAWIAGHVAWEDDDCLKALIEGRGSKLPRPWHDRFAQGSQPMPDSHAYLDIAEIRANLTTLREELIGFFAASAERLTDLVPEEVHGFAKDLSALMPAIACHEMLHVGQLTVIRKSLKLKPVFG